MRSSAILLLVVFAASCTGTIDTTLVGAVCGDAIVNGQEACDTGRESQTCDSDCTPPVCGDGRVNARFTPPGASGPEECDDGGTTSGDGCSSACQLEAPTTIEPRCGDGIVGPDELCDTSVDSATCDADCTAPVCGDGHVNKSFTPPGGPTFEHCDDGGNVDGDGCSSACQFEWCGNGITDGEEPCDDGNTDDLDACRNDCTLHVCGDGVDSLAEACDAGGDGPACDADCTIAECGDARVNRNFTPLGAPGVEQCDDGGTEDGDGCSALCQIETCGNGVHEPANGEQCDDGNETDGDACRNDCRLPRCGDGVTNGTDACDTSALNSATCNFDCTLPACGDGIVNRSFTPLLAPGVEQCDDGGLVDGDGCSALCQIETCGNGVTEGVNGEACDDGNTVDDDECRNNCQLPACGDGVASTGEVCDSGGANAPTCDFDCSAPQCGDGIVNGAFTPVLAPGPEQCDDGGMVDGDGCSALCQIETCGNGVPESANGEQCDDGNLVDTDDCRTNCQNARCGDGVVKASAPAEACDDGGVNTATCDYDCSAPQCGDGIANPAAGEECDDGNDDASDGCAVCRYSFIEALSVLSFGPTEVGFSAGALPVRIRNASSTESIGPIDVVLTGDADFVVTGSDCDAGLPPGSDCTIFIDFQPITIGPRAGQAAIGSDGLGGRITVPLFGLGSP